MRRFVDDGGLWVLGQGVVLLGVAAALLWGAAGDVPTGLLWAGLVVAVAGVALAGDALRRLRPHITALPAPVPGAPLVEAGSYGLVRHPIYGGLTVSALGLAIAVASWSGVVAAGVLGVFFFLKSRFEEKLVAEAHTEYPEYAQRVRRRLIPWIV